jgi:hypothetical protein
MVPADRTVTVVINRDRLEVQIVERAAPPTDTNEESA